LIIYGSQLQSYSLRILFHFTARFSILHDAHVAPKDPVTSYFNFLFLRHERIVGGDKSDISSGESWQDDAAVVSRDKKRVTNLDVCASAFVGVTCECGRIHRSIERYISLTTLPPVATRLLTRPKYQPTRTTTFRDTWTPRGFSCARRNFFASRAHAFIASAFSFAISLPRALTCVIRRRR